MSTETTEKELPVMVLVSCDALSQLLRAISGPAHYIRELQATRNLPGDNNCIDVLMTQYNAFVKKHNGCETANDLQHAAALAIVEDLTNRQGLRNVWETTDADIQQEIIQKWSEIIRKTQIG